MIQRASVKCKQSPRFTELFDRYFHIPLPIVTKHELGLPFPAGNLPMKFGTNPSTIFLVIVVTDTHADKPTPVETNSLALAEIIKVSKGIVKKKTKEINISRTQRQPDELNKRPCQGGGSRSRCCLLQRQKKRHFLHLCSIIRHQTSRRAFYVHEIKPY